MNNLFGDSDGVYADFDGHIKELFGRWPWEMSDEEMWQKAAAHPEFWSHMPIKEGAEELWEFMKPHNPIILTGCPKSDYERAEKHKKEWWKKHFDHDQVITCLSRDKAKHMHAPGDVLVDDMIKNIKRWEKAGGRGVLFKNARDAIDQLKALGF